MSSNDTELIFQSQKWQENNDNNDKCVTSFFVFRVALRTAHKEVRYFLHIIYSTF